MTERPRAIIVGAGPAGLTAASECLDRTPMIPLLLESDTQVGGLSKTVQHHGNRIDIGGHRFFTKSKRVEEWWFRQQVKFLLRERLSRILFLGKLFDYPISLSYRTLANLGLIRCFQIIASYAAEKLRPGRPVRTLEDFFISRFGRKLYKLFFEDYTEKVWGVPCTAIKPDWGAQRVKGLSIVKTLADAIRKKFKLKSRSGKTVETSLIEQFHYPPRGPGQLWESVADHVQTRGGEVRLQSKVTRLEHSEGRLIAALSTGPGGERRDEGSVFISTMPLQDLVEALEPPAPPEIRKIARDLRYRDFVTVGLLFDKKSVAGRGISIHDLPDNWIYVQEPQVRMGRIQIFNNWSPGMVASPDQTWIGLEYFCQEGDALWNQSDDEWRELGRRELREIGLLGDEPILDFKVVKVQKAYPAYFGSYDRIGELKQYLDRFENLYLIGRNGQHRYNNSDHSILTALIAVDCIASGNKNSALLWSVNVEQEYHEAKS